MSAVAVLSFICPITNRRAKASPDYSDGSPVLEAPEEGETIELPAGWGDLRIRTVVTNPEWIQAGEGATAETMDTFDEMLKEAPEDQHEEIKSRVPAALDAAIAEAREDIPEKLYLSYEFSVISGEGLAAVVTALKTVPGLVFKEV